MNQILATSNNENNKKDKIVKNEKQFKSEAFDLERLNAYSNNPTSKNSNANIDTKKIIIIFAIALIVFGIILLSIYGVKIYKEKKLEVSATLKPEIIIKEDGNNANILITSDIGLSKITYYWDENDVQEANGNGTKKYEKAVEIPGGENTLYVKAIDNNGQEFETNKSFRIDGDVAEPVITTNAVGTGQVKIIATDETSMDYITYYWENGEETKVEVENEGDTEIETTVDIQRGNNTLYIKAMDTSGNEATKTMTYQGVLKPTIYVVKQGSKLYMKVSHDKGLKKIEYSINGTEFVYDENYSGYDATNANVEFTVNLKEGENIVGIVATSLEQSVDGEYTQESYKGKCTYTPAE